MKQERPLDNWFEFGQFKNYDKNTILVPVILDSGYPAYYNMEQDYPYMQVLDAKEWKDYHETSIAGRS